MASYIYIAEGIAGDAQDTEVYLSTDQGENWVVQGTFDVSPVYGTVIYADPFIPYKGFFCNQIDGTIYYTLDGFATIILSGGTYTVGANFKDVCSASSTKIFAVNDTYVISSIDGGLTFSDLTSVVSINPAATGGDYKLYFPNENIGFIVLDDKLYKTTDLGATWTEELAITPISADVFLDVTCSNSGDTIIVSGILGYYTSINGGVSWSTVTFSATGLTAIHKYSNTEYYVINARLSASTIYRSTDSGATYSNISSDYQGNFPIKKQWLHYFSPYVAIAAYDQASLYKSIDTGSTFTSVYVTKTRSVSVAEFNCGVCPPEYTFIDGECTKDVTYPAVYSLPDFLELVQGGTKPGQPDNQQPYGYGQRGLNLMQEVSAGTLPILGDGTTNAGFNFLANNGSGAPVARETGYTPIYFGVNSPISPAGSTNTLWRFRLQTVGVWVNSNVLDCNPNTSPTPCVPVAFSYCVNIPVTKIYLIGISGDNESRFKVDGFTYLRITGQSGTMTATFNYWHVFPIQLSTGQHTIELEGYNFGGAASFGAEIYDISVVDFKTQFCDAPNPTEAQLEPYILFSTKNFIGSQIPDPSQEGYPGEWQCEDGSEVSYCFGLPVCSYKVTAPIITCYYKLISCLDIEVFMYTPTDLSSYIGQTVKLEDSSCWIVDGITDVYTDPVEVVVQSSYSECTLCLPSYQLVNCKDPDAIIYTSTDLSDYVQPSQVIKLNEYPGECWTAGTNNKAEFIPQDVTVDGEPFTTCIKCNPTIYQLNNCFNGSNFILSDSDLAAVMGKTISIVGYPGLCFSVGEPTCDCIKISGDLGGGAFSMDVQKTGISLNGRNQYAFTDDGTDYFINWDSIQSAWVLTNLTLSVEVSISPIDIECPYSSYWRDLTNFVVESCSTVLYDIIIDTIYPNCECCITKSCN